MVVGVVAACAAGCHSNAAAVCGPALRETLDPAYLVHVLGADAAKVRYTTDPPTSGPHQPGPAIDGVVAEPIARPLQVSILERGDVLVQHRPGLSPSAVAELEALAGRHVVVAPNPDLPSPVVATAWVEKLRCDAVDTAALRTFIAERQGRGPGG